MVPRKLLKKMVSTENRIFNPAQNALAPMSLIRLVEMRGRRKAFHCTCASCTFPLLLEVLLWIGGAAGYLYGHTIG
jgi:hypothetical protein